MAFRFALAAAAMVAAPALAAEPFDLLTPAEQDRRNPALALIPPGPSADTCRDRVIAVREERGLPPLVQRDSRVNDDVMRIYAVDRRVDGCNVLVMADGSGEIRPLPQPDPDAPLLRPLQ